MVVYKGKGEKGGGLVGVRVRVNVMIRIRGRVRVLGLEF